jgi:hypothetical protein
VTADCKGIVIRGQGTPTVCGGQRPAGQRANQKRMATVGAVYTVDPYQRTVADVVAALFRDEDYKAPPRPQPCHKHVWASLPDDGPQSKSSIDKVFTWLWWVPVPRRGSPKDGITCFVSSLAAVPLIRPASSATPVDPALSALGHELTAIRETGGVFRRRLRTTPNP